MYAAVIFDWDGTLADTKKAILYSFHTALKEIDADVSDEQIDRLIGIGAAETFKEILRAKNVELDEALIRKLVDRKIKAELEVSDQTKLFDGALELLQSLKGHVKLGLASMKNPPLVEYLLQTTKTKTFFEAVVTVEDIHRNKPDPEIFLKTAQKLQTTPERCVVVEDSIFGVEAAKAAKMACIAVEQGAYTKKELAKAQPDLIVSSLKQKNVILKFISK
jgi:HAD superfamily hydrolase (TIGR01509 family)